MEIVKPLIERFRREPADPTSPVLVAIPHAGAGASTFFSWRTRLSPEVELAAVRLPGRERDIGAPALPSIAAQVNLIVAALRAWAPMNFAIFGQCSGALTAFEVARETQRLGGQQPERLFVASQLPPDDLEGGISIDGDTISKMDQINFFSYLASLGKLSTRISFGSEIWEMVAPAFRSDLIAIGNFEFTPGRPLEVPITAMIGEKDEWLTRNMVEGWSRQTSDFDICTISAGHLMAEEANSQIIECIETRWIDLLSSGL